MCSIFTVVLVLFSLQTIHQQILLLNPHLKCFSSVDTLIDQGKSSGRLCATMFPSIPPIPGSTCLYKLLVLLFFSRWNLFPSPLMWADTPEGTLCGFILDFQRSHSFFSCPFAAMEGSSASPSWGWAVKVQTQPSLRGPTHVLEIMWGQPAPIRNTN